MEKVKSNTWQTSLYRTVSERIRPEDVARDVVTFFPNAPHIAKWKARRTKAVSYMPTEFPEPHPLTRTANVLAVLLGKPVMSDSQTLGPEMTKLLKAAKREISMGAGKDYKNDRLNREQRTKKGLIISRRRYNKIFRIVSFLEEEIENNKQFGKVCELLRGAKSGLARHLQFKDFSNDPQTAMFVAYMCARMNLRSEFIAGPQTKAFDDLAKAMFETLENSKTTNWFAVAHVFPRTDIIKKLSDEQKTALLVLSLQQLRSAAEVLSELHDTYEIDYRVSTTVQRGQDSSTWNAAAGAWNKTRDWWVSLLHAMRMWDSLTHFMPGKVLRLIAADIAAWHRSMGGSVHPDEMVARELPAPWEVFLAEAECPQRDVIAACIKCGVDPEKSGWASPRPRTEVESWTPTPELVHGVTVSNPELALVLRKLKWASGPAKYYRSGKRSTRTAKKQTVVV